MKCRDMDILLSAYANKELDSAQSELVERHLTSCNRCRESLAHFVESSQQLRSLTQTPLLPDMKPSIISRIITRDVKVRPRKRLRLVLGVMSVAIVGILLISLHLAGFFIDPAAVVSRAYAATTKITTYYSFMKVEQSTSDLNTTSIVYEEVEYDGPERYHVKQFSQGPDAWQFEIINYNGEVYYYADFPLQPSSPDLPEWVQDVFKRLVYATEQRFSFLAISQLAEPQNVFDYLIDVEQLPDKELDGLICFHYLAAIDKEKMATEFENSINEPDDLDLTESEYELLQSSIDAIRHPESQMQLEIWISKDDNLIRQWKYRVHLHLSVGTQVNEVDGVQTLNYQYNIPIIIRAPLAEDGELEPGWHLYSDLIK